MTESEERIILSRGQNQIFERIYQNISSNGFDTNINFDGIETGKLIDFSLSAAGFLSVQNFENLESTLHDSDIKKIIGGTFKLKILTPREVEELTTGIKTHTNNRKNHSTTALFTIQDGKYSIVSKNGRNVLTLQTPPIEYQFKGVEKLEPRELFRRVRNLLAHSVQYKSNSKILLFSNDGCIEISKMWLRGYSELFVSSSETFDTLKAKIMLTKELQQTGNYLESFEDINKGLSAIKSIFPPEIVTNYYRVNNFVNFRLKYQPDFFKKPIDEKIEMLIQLLEKNPNFLTGSNETINPSIVYNIQQLVSDTLKERKVSTTLNPDDDIYARQAEILEKISAFNRKYKMYEMVSEKKKDPKHLGILLSLEKEVTKLSAEFDGINREIENRKKMESSSMILYNTEDIRNLPVEVASNVVALLGYNNLITSGFFEDTLAKTDINTLTPEQEKFFNKINLNNIICSQYGQKFSKPYNAESICLILTFIRNSISHGMISYRFPSLKSGQVADFKDVELTFYLDRQDIMVTASVDEFYKLFMSGSFTMKRPKEVITGYINEVKTTSPISTNENGE